jgi:hypothetical protein
MDTTPVTSGVLEGLDRYLALDTRPETQEAVTGLKKAYSDRVSHEARVRSAREELQAAEADLLAHGYPDEPTAIVDEGVLHDMDARLTSMAAARAKFREARDDKAA